MSKRIAYIGGCTEGVVLGIENGGEVKCPHGKFVEVSDTVAASISIREDFKVEEDEDSKSAKKKSKPSES